VLQKNTGIINVPLLAKPNPPKRFKTLDKESLAPYFPETSLDTVFHWMQSHPLQLIITRERATKSGDYRPPDKEKPYHRISVNHNLNKYAFLITFTHEYAHLITWNAFKRKARPHGDEWKANYRSLVFFLLEKNIFPPDLSHALVKIFVKNGEPVHAAEYNLTLTLAKYDTNATIEFLEELAPDSVFSIHNGLVFRKGEKLRTRYKCFCLNNKRWYLINAAMKVNPVSKAFDFELN